MRPRMILLTAGALASAAAALAAAKDDAPAPDLGPAGGLRVLVLGVEGEEPGLGAQVAFMLRRKARRLGAIVYDPTSVGEALAGTVVTVETPPDRLRALARDRFQADVAVVGRVTGAGKDYRVRLVSVRPDGGGRELDRTWVCSHHQIIPIEMAKAVRAVLGLAPLAEGEPEDPELERRWREGPNLVANPGFEEGGGPAGGPARWQAVEKEMAWVENPDGPGKVLKYDMSPGTAGGYGLDFYSDWIAIEAGATYRFSVRLKSLGPTPKVFLKGYHAFPPVDGYPAQRREVYRRQVHPKGAKGVWQTAVATFIPSAARPEHTPTHLKVDLYAYYPAGVIYWDDVVLKKVRAAPPDEPDEPGAAAETAPAEATP